jgi:membrane-associated phospholipid phosphatase
MLDDPQDAEPVLRPWSWRRRALTVAGCLLFLAASVLWLDRPIAWRVGHPRGIWHAVSLLRHVISIGLDALLALLLLSLFELVRALAAAMRGAAVARSARAVILAGLSATATIVLNDLVLKPVFSRYTIDYFLSPSGLYGFRFFGGDITSSFPSGHAGLVASYFFVLQAFYPHRRALWLSIAGLAFAGLVAAQWHFLSDIAAGAMTGSAVAVSVLRLVPRIAGGRGRGQSRR